MIPHPRTMSKFIRDLAAAEALGAAVQRDPALEAWCQAHVDETDALARESVEQSKESRVDWLIARLQEKVDA